ncbi:hypothetical protein [Spiroplasma endosymbiont of Dactylopius coccus]
MEKKLDNEKRKEKEINKKISCLTNQDINNKNELKIRNEIRKYENGHRIISQKVNYFEIKFNSIKEELKKISNLKMEIYNKNLEKLKIKKFDEVEINSFENKNYKGFKIKSLKL